MRARLNASAARSAAWQDRQPPAAPMGCWRPHQGQVPGGCFHPNRRHGLHRPLVSCVRSPQPQPHLGGQPGHRVVPGRSKPLARSRQLAARRRRTRQRGGRGRHPDLEVTAVAGPVALINRGGHHPAGQLADLTPVTGLQEPEEQIDRPGLAAPGPGRLVPLNLAQEPVSMRGLDLPHRNLGPVQELLHRRGLAADRAIGHAVGQPGQHELGQQVLLISRGLIGGIQRPRGPQVPDHPQHQVSPRLQQSRRKLAITEHCSGLPKSSQESAHDTPTGLQRHLTCAKARPARSTVLANCRKVQHLARLDHVVNTRFTFAGFPLKLRGAHGGPTRAVALVG